MKQTNKKNKKSRIRIIKALKEAQKFYKDAPIAVNITLPDGTVITNLRDFMETLFDE